MTPAEYFAKHPTACEPAQDFCARFPTMRDAWMSPEVIVSHMLWALGREDANRAGLVAFAKWCADHAADSARSAAFAASAAADASAVVAVVAADAAAAYAAAYAADAAADASTFAADVADDAAAAYAYAYAADAYAYAAARQAQREKLRELFPNQFAA